MCASSRLRCWQAASSPLGSGLSGHPTHALSRQSSRSPSEQSAASLMLAGSPGDIAAEKCFCAATQQRCTGQALLAQSSYVQRGGGRHFGAHQGVADGSEAAAEDVAGVALQRAQALAHPDIPQLQREVVRGGAQLLTARIPAQSGDALHAAASLLESASMQVLAQRRQHLCEDVHYSDPNGPMGASSLIAGPCQHLSDTASWHLGARCA